MVVRSLKNGKTREGKRVHKRRKQKEGLSWREEKGQQERRITGKNSEGANKDIYL